MRDQARRIEEERARLREEMQALRERCDTDDHPTDEEMREFGEKVAAFAREALPHGGCPTKVMGAHEREAVARAAVSLDPESRCPGCNFEFGGACYVILYEEGRGEVSCDCCVGPLLAGGTFEDRSGRRGRVEYVELG